MRRRCGAFTTAQGHDARLPIVDIQNDYFEGGAFPLPGSANAAADLGFSVTVAQDACAASDLEFDGVEVVAASVHAAFMAGLTEYGAVLASAEILNA